MTIEFPQIKLIIIIIILETRLSYQAKHCEASYALISAYFPLCQSPMLTLYSNIIKSWEGFWNQHTFPLKFAFEHADPSI